MAGDIKIYASRFPPDLRQHGPQFDAVARLYSCFQNESNLRLCAASMLGRSHA